MFYLLFAADLCMHTLVTLLSACVCVCEVYKYAVFWFVFLLWKTLRLLQAVIISDIDFRR